MDLSFIETKVYNDIFKHVRHGDEFGSLECFGSAMGREW